MTCIYDSVSVFLVGVVRVRGRKESVDESLSHLPNIAHTPAVGHSQGQTRHIDCAVHISPGLFTREVLSRLS